MARFLKGAQRKINVAADYKTLCETVTQEILALSNQKIATHNKFTVVLSGGSTPQGVYQCMSSAAYQNKFQWGKIHFFWGDERWVSHEDQRSNYQMVSKALLTKVQIPSANIHLVQTNGREPEEGAHLYANAIEDFFKLTKGDLPCFDLFLLGLGLDGHTASLFPGNPVLLVKDRLVMAVSQKGIPEPRITMTFPVINHAKTIFFLVSGQDKASVVHEVLENDHHSDLPVDEVKPVQGEVYWFLDEGAACQLERKNV